MPIPNPIISLEWSEKNNEEALRLVYAVRSI